MYKGAVKFT